MREMDDFLGTPYSKIIEELYFNYKTNRTSLESISNELYISLSTLQRCRNKFCGFIERKFSKKILT